MKGDHFTPATEERMAELREQERQRKRFDPGYLSAEDAAKLSDVAKQDPTVRARVESSMPHWPENEAAMSATLRGVQDSDNGVPTDRRDVNAADVFAGRKVGEE